MGLIPPFLEYSCTNLINVLLYCIAYWMMDHKYLPCTLIDDGI